MKYVILRDDDTNAAMPVSCLERLYRPFLDRNMPVNLAVIPYVSTQASYAPGQLEKFLLAYSDGPTGAGIPQANNEVWPESSNHKTTTCVHRSAIQEQYLPIGSNQALIEYLSDNPQFHIVQHGCCHEAVHDHYEFDHNDRAEIARRLDTGIELLEEAGFGRPTTFVAPYDQLSRASLDEAARRFKVISTGWYALSRIPQRWWPSFFCKKLLRNPHWRAGNTILLTHPGCHLSYHRSYSIMLHEIERSIESRRLTVLVTHWWEYFRDGQADHDFIDVLHETAAWLSARRDVCVISFDDLAKKNISLN